jgi:hypothetical protein
VVSKLAQILPTGAPDYIFDDSEKNILLRAHIGLYGKQKIVKIARDMQL